jgi:O-antigen ligase
LGFSYFLKKQSKTPILELSGFALLVCGFVVANTRGAIVGLVAGIISSILIFLIFRSKKATESSARLVALTAIIAVLIGLALSLMVANQKSDTKIPFLGRFSASNLNDASIANRLTAWSNAWQGFKQNPILGVGPENFRKISDLYFDPLIIKGGASENYFDKPHSVLLEILSTSGLLGFLAFLYLLYLAFKNSLLFLSSPAEKAIAFGAIIAYLGQGFFSFDSFATYLTFFAGLAVLALMRADSAKPNKQ